MPMWIVRMVAEYPWGVAETGRGLPLFDVLADGETGACVGAGPIIQHQYDALNIWL